MNTTSTHADSAHPSPARHTTSLLALWFGLFGAPAAWSLQELINTALTSHACFPAMTPHATPLYDNLRLLLLAVSVLAIALAIAAALTAYNTWRRTADEHEGGHHHLLEVGEGRTRFMAFAGIVVSVVFAINILLNAAAAVIVGPCS